MSQKTVPALYATSTKGTFYKHCSINKTLYFEILRDEQRAAIDPDYAEYMESMKDECYQAIIHKYITSQPLKVTNDKIPFLIFKSNADMRLVRMFCQSILDELYFSTDVDHKAKLLMTETIFLELDKNPSMFKANRIGEKLTQSKMFKNDMEILEGNHEKIDSGIVTPYKEFLALKQQAKEEEEEIVKW